MGQAQASSNVGLGAHSTALQVGGTIPISELSNIFDVLRLCFRWCSPLVLAHI